MIDHVGLGVSDLDQSKAALFVLVRKAKTDKVLEHLGKFHGKVLQTSLSHELDSKLQAVLDQAHQVSS